MKREEEVEETFDVSLRNETEFCSWWVRRLGSFPKRAEPKKKKRAKKKKEKEEEEEEDGYLENCTSLGVIRLGGGPRCHCHRLGPAEFFLFLRVTHRYPPRVRKIKRKNKTEET